MMSSCRLVVRRGLEGRENGSLRERQEQLTLKYGARCTVLPLTSKNGILTYLQRDRVTCEL